MATKSKERSLGNIVGEQHARIVRLLLFTGGRKNEIVALRWCEIDAATRFLRLSNSKTGQKEIALGAAALAILNGIERTDSPFVFPDPDDGRRPVRNLNWAWECIRSRADLPDVTLHDLRHSFAAIADGRGLSLRMIGGLLGHKSASSTARYAHLAQEAMLDGADAIGGLISGAGEGKSAELLRMGDGA